MGNIHLALAGFGLYGMEPRPLFVLAPVKMSDDFWLWEQCNKGSLKKGGPLY